MTNTERIQANNAELRECIEIAENLPNAGAVQTENKLAKVISNQSVEITEEDLKGATTIKNYAFYGNTNLGNVTVPSTVKSISKGAFYNCRNMLKLSFPHHTSVPTLSNTDALNGTSDELQILVPADLAVAWKAATNWSTYASKIIGNY